MDNNLKLRCRFYCLDNCVLMAVTKLWLTELEIYHRLVSGVDGVSGVFSPSLPLGVGKCFASTKVYQHNECLLKVVKNKQWLRLPILIFWDSENSCISYLKNW